MGVFSKKGRERVRRTMTDPSHPPGVRKLKDPMNHIGAHTASDKWFLGYILQGAIHGEILLCHSQEVAKREVRITVLFLVHEIKNSGSHLLV